MMWLYLLTLIVAIFCMSLIDYRYKLAWWSDARRTAKTLVISLLFFIVWDLCGIFLGIFFHGNSMYSLPYTIVPEFPIEEIFFLYLLCYSALIIYRGVFKWRRM